MRLSHPLTSKSLLAGLIATVFMTGASVSAQTVAQYRFEGGSPGSPTTVIEDVSGNGYDLNVTIGGGDPEAVYSDDVPVSTIPQTGDANAVSLDLGAGEVAFMGENNDDFSEVEFDDFTVEVWVKFHDPGGWQTIVGRDDSGDPGQADGAQSLFYLSSSGADGANNGFRVEVANRNGQMMAVNSTALVEADTWYHVAAVGDSGAGTLTLYVDGIQLGSTSGFAGLFIPSDPATPWTVGRGQFANNPGDWLNGIVDEIRISDAALPASEFLNFDPDSFQFTDHPEGRILWAGQDVTFEADYVAGAGVQVDLQWQVSTDGGNTWDNITGADGTSYTITGATANLDRNLYRLFANADGQQATTDSALLRVGDVETPPMPEEVVAYFRFEEGSPGSTPSSGPQDTSGNNHEFEEVIADGDNPMEFTSDVPTDLLPFNREDNEVALDLTGGVNFFQGVDGDSLSQVEWDDFTIELYVNHHVVPGWQTYIGRDDRGRQNDDNASLFYLSSHNDGWFRTHVFMENEFGEGENVFIEGDVTPEEGRWYHVALVGDTATNTLTLYADGQPIGSAEGFYGLFKPDPVTRWTIGRGQWGEDDSVGESHGDFVNGMIDEVRFTAAALTPADFLNFNNAVLNFAFHPSDAEAFVSEEVSFSALAGGGGLGELTFQWQISEDFGQNWTDIDGATSSTYTIDFPTLGMDGNMYRMVAEREGDTEISESATLSVPGYPPPTILEAPTAQVVFEGEEVSFNVEATGLGELSYQWRKDGEDLAGETGPSLDLGEVEVEDSGTYEIVVSDDAAEADGLDPTTATITTQLGVVRRPAEAISLNFVGVGANYPFFTREIGLIDPDDEAGVVPVAGWNNSAEVSGINNRPATAVFGPDSESLDALELHDDLGNATGATASWESANTWGVRNDLGMLPDKDGHQRIFHGYIEGRGGSSATISDIPYAMYDVYVYVSYEGAEEGSIRSVTLVDEDEEETTFFGIHRVSITEDLAPIPYLLAGATSVEDAEVSGPATVFRFGDVSGSTFTIQHEDEVGPNLGGIAGISIVNTSPGTNPRPVFTQRPSSSFMPAGGTAQFSASAEAAGGGSVSYQWEKDGSALGGETGSVLTLEEVTSADTGRYTVEVTDGATGAINRSSASLVVVDSGRYALISGDIHNIPHNLEGFETQAIPTTDTRHMSGHAILRADGTVIEVDPNQGESNPDQIGEGDTVWTRLPDWQLAGIDSWSEFVDSEGFKLPGITFSISGAAGIEEDHEGGGIDEPITDYSGPLLRDYVFSEGDDEMTMTLSGLQGFAGREVTLVVYAVGKDSVEWLDAEGNTPGQNDNATVTLAAVNSPTGEEQSGQTVIDSGSGFEGRDLRFNNNLHVAFDAVIAPNGTLTWTVGPVPGDPGLNAFNGFQLLLTAEGDAPPPPEGIGDWRMTHFGTSANEGDAANDADPDGDGFLNLVEYALGTDPTVAGDAHGAVSLGQDNGFLTLTFSHIGDPAVEYAIEATNDLGDEWTTVHTFPPFATAGTETYTDDVSADSESSRFIRLSVRLTE